MGVDRTGRRGIMKRGKEDEKRLELSSFKKYLKGYSTFFLERVSFYNSLRVKQLSFTVFESIQQII